MLEDHNLTTQTYNKAVANRIYARILDVYAGAFRDALERAT